MKLSGIFQAAQPRTLAKAPKPVAQTKGQSQQPETSALASAIQNRRRPGDLGIAWPKARPQQVKDYKPILSLADLDLYLDKCEATGEASFDWETAANEKTRAAWAEYVEAYQAQRFDYQHMADKITAQGWEKSTEGTAKQRAAEDKRREKEHKIQLAIWTNKIDDLDAQYSSQRAAYLKAPLDPHKGEICTVSISAAEHESRVIPISHKAGRIFEPELSRDEARRLVMERLDKRLFRSQKVTKIAVNLAFETKYAAKYGKYILGPVADPFLMWVRCLQVAFPGKIKDPKEPAKGWGLKPATHIVFGVIMGEFTKLLEKYGVDFFDEIPADAGDGLNYSAEDSDYGLQHYHFWRPVAQAIPMYDDWLHRIEMPFARVVGLMEYRGMAWDGHLAEMKRQEAAAAQEHASNEIKRIAYEACGLEVSPGKTGKTNGVKHLLFEVMKLPMGKPTDAGGISLNEEALLDIQFMLENKLHNLDEEKLLGVELPEGWEEIEIPPQLAEGEKQPPDWFTRYAEWHRLDKDVRGRIEIARRDFHPYKDAALELLGHMKLIQKYTTLLSSHVEGREKWVNPDSGGRIHANYSPFTETSRLKSDKPNGQNVPRTSNDKLGVRNMYRAADGKILFFIDFSGFELRILAWKSGDEVMIEIFCTGGDMHRKTAAAIADKPESDVTKDERTDAKPANFGIAYGGTEYALQTVIKTDYGQRKSLPECAVMVAGVHKAYPRIKESQRAAILDAREKGYSQTMYGYIRLLPDINSSNNYAKSSDERRAMNTPIQGTAADVMKRAQNEVYDETGRGTILAADAAELGVDPAQLAADRGEAPPVLVHDQADMAAQIHDEIIFEMDDDPDVVEAAWKWVQAAMEQPPIEGFPVPIEAEASVGYRWGEKIPVQKWLDEKRAEKKGA